MKRRIAEHLRSHGATALALACLAGILTFQLIVPPIIGLANQGDFARIIGRFGYGPADTSEPRFYYFVQRVWVPDAHFRLPVWEFFSSENILAWAAVHLNAWFGSRQWLDLRVIGALHITALIAIAALLLAGARRVLPGPGYFVVCGAAVLVLGDTAYAAYLNSFFSEPATLLFLLLTIAIWLHVLAGSKRPAVLIALGTAAVLFLTAKPQNSVAAPVLAIALARLWPGLDDARQRTSLAITVAAVLIGGVFSFKSPPANYGSVAAYNALFMGVLPVSTAPAEDLRWFGLRSELTEYAGTGAFGTKNAFQLPGFAEEFRAHVTHGKLAAFYLLHPARAVAHIETVLPVSLSLRPEFCGNFERETVIKRGIREPLARSHALSLWSDLRDTAIARRSAAWVPVLLAASILVALVLIFRADSQLRRRVYETYAALAAIAVLAFLSATLGDAWDNVKHLFLYNLLVDVCAVFALAALIQRAASARPQAPSCAAGD